jgi:hypothetical protein
MPTSLENNQPISSQPNKYRISKQSEKKLYGKEDHIIKKTPLLGTKITADKLTHDVFVYAPKGLKGSRNSNFYESLSLSMLPYIAGGATIIALYNLANKHYKPSEAMKASNLGKRMAIGVACYAAGKWLAGKVLNGGVKAATGIDVEMPYKKTVHELPEEKGEIPGTSTEFHRVYESVDFPRWDLINRKGEFEGNRYAYYDKIAKRMGYDEKLNAPDQVVQPKIKETVAKTIATKNISSYLWAATALVFGMNEDIFTLIKARKIPKSKKEVKSALKLLGDDIKHVCKNFWNGGGKNSTASTVLRLANKAAGFKNKKDNKSEINFNKKYGEF